MNLEASSAIADVFRSGRCRKDQRQHRAVNVKFSNSWEMRKTLSNTYMLKKLNEEAGINIVSKELTKEGMDGMEMHRIKIRGMKLFMDNKEVSL